MTVQEFIQRLAACSPGAHIVVPGQRCGEEPDASTSDGNDVLHAAKALLGAREDQMLTRVEWDALERAVAAIGSASAPPDQPPA